MTQTHVVGAGIAGLAAAVSLTQAGRQVVLHEAANQAGGRCRSFHDAKLDRLIDNGTHLILGANPALFRLMSAVGGDLQGSKPAAFPFYDAVTGQSWSISPSKRAIPWWVLKKAQRLPETSALDYLSGFRLTIAKPSQTVADVIGKGPLLERLWRPLCDAILNTAPEEGQARLLGEVLKRTLLKGEKACRPYIAPYGLSQALIDPALSWLRANGAEIRLNHRQTSLEGRALVFDDGERIAFSKSAPVILAVSPWIANTLLSTLPRFDPRPIVNAHFILSTPITALPGGRTYLGVVRGLGQWWSLRGDVLSVTVSAATELSQQSAEDIAAKLWAETSGILDLPKECPPWRIMKEQRATIAHTPANEALRPNCLAGPEGLILAGDWTDTGLPCTLEGAAQSGETAAKAFLTS